MAQRSWCRSGKDAEVKWSLGKDGARILSQWKVTMVTEGWREAVAVEVCCSGRSWRWGVEKHVYIYSRHVCIGAAGNCRLCGFDSYQGFRNSRRNFVVKARPAFSERVLWTLSHDIRGARSLLCLAVRVRDAGQTGMALRHNHL